MSEVTSFGGLSRASLSRAGRGGCLGQDAFSLTNRKTPSLTLRGQHRRRRSNTDRLRSHLADRTQPAQSHCAIIDTAMSLVSRNIDQSSRDIARAFLEVQYRASPIGSPSHESGCHRRNVNLDVFDAGVRVVMLRARAEDHPRLAGLHDGETLPDSRDDRPLADRPSGGGGVREMERGPRPPLTLAGECRQCLEPELM